MSVTIDHETARRAVWGQEDDAESDCLFVSLTDKRTGAATAIFQNALDSGIVCRIEQTPSAQYAARGYHESARRMHEDWCRRR